MGLFLTTLLTVGALTLFTAAASGETIVTVAQDGSGQFSTVQSAVDSLPPDGNQRCIVDIKPGVYNERVRIPQAKSKVTLRGHDANTTLITHRLGVREMDENGKVCGTFDTATVYVYGNDFVAEGLTFENTFGKAGQALAMSVNGDRAIFRNCRFLGWQDTLYTTKGREYFKNCYIEGQCDFIFGNAKAVFQDCTIHAAARGHITAQGAESAPENGGYVFVNCRLTAPEGVQDVRLGRPWRFSSKVIFESCWMGPQISPMGWHNWGEPRKELTSFCAEHNSTGPGANPAARAKWSHQLTDAEAEAYRPELFLRGEDGWNPVAEAGDTALPKACTSPTTQEAKPSDPTTQKDPGGASGQK